MRFSNSLTISRPPDDVFDFLAHFENVPTWNYAISETRKTSNGPVGVGTTYRQTRSILRPSEESFEVTEFAEGFGGLLGLPAGTRVLDRTEVIRR